MLLHESCFTLNYILLVFCHLRNALQELLIHVSSRFLALGLIVNTHLAHLVRTRIH